MDLFDKIKSNQNGSSLFGHGVIVQLCHCGGPRFESGRPVEVEFYKRGSVSAEHGGSLFPPHSIPFHSRPGKREMFLSGLTELVMRTCICLGFKNLHNCMFE